MVLISVHLLVLRVVHLQLNLSNWALLCFWTGRALVVGSKAHHDIA